MTNLLRYIVLTKNILYTGSLSVVVRKIHVPQVKNKHDFFKKIKNALRNIRSICIPSLP